VLLGNEEDLGAALGFEAEQAAPGFSRLDAAAHEKTIAAVVAAFPRLSVVATTLRAAHTATRNDWGALCWADGVFHRAPDRLDLEIHDRVGGGDSFASGLVYGLLAGRGPQWAVECGAAHGALAMTTSGDTSMATLAEVERVMAGAGARIAR
jgi:2-dehydro-3-deoxygluconokinase